MTFDLGNTPASSHLQIAGGDGDIVSRLPQQILIMWHHHVSVMCQVTVQLQHLCALLHRTADRCSHGEKISMNRSFTKQKSILHHPSLNWHWSSFVNLTTTRCRSDFQRKPTSSQLIRQPPWGAQSERGWVYKHRKSIIESFYYQIQDKLLGWKTS